MTTHDKGKPDNDKTLSKDAKETVAATSEAAREKAQGVAETVATEAGSYASDAKDAAAGEVKDVASALRTAADELRSGSPQERTFSQVADSLADASDALRQKDLGEMVGAVNDFAKRNPMVFLGSAALIGFAATRFAKASSGSSAHLESDRLAHRDRQSPRPSVTTTSGHPTGGVSSQASTTSVKGGTA